jgi:predicted transcriptional regulator
MSSILRALAVLIALPLIATGQETKTASQVGVVCHVKVVSDKVPDMTNLETWKKAYIKEGMSDAEKALVVWKTVRTFQHQEAPPNEFLQNESAVQDPFKIFNVYGYSLCSIASSDVECLARYAGLKARGRIINSHSVPEIFYDGEWHLLDSSLLCYFPKADGKLASVDEIMAGVKEWYEKNPSYKKNDAKLREFMRAGGLRKGPEVLSRCPSYDENGWFEAATHGWYSTMQEYDGSANGIYEYGYSQGYEVNIRLRPGERPGKAFNDGPFLAQQPL